MFFRECNSLIDTNVHVYGLELKLIVAEMNMHIIECFCNNNVWCPFYNYKNEPILTYQNCYRTLSHITLEIKRVNCVIVG